MDYSQAPQTPQAQQRPAGTNKPFAGRLTKDPHEFTTGSGAVGVNLEFALDVKNSDGTQGVSFCKATYWGTDGKLAVDFLAKGDVVSGTGKQYVNHYTKNDGTPGSQVVYDGVTLLFTASQVMSLISRIVDSKLNAFAQTVQTTPATPVTAATPTVPATPTTQAAPSAPVAPTQPAAPVQPQSEPTIQIDSSELPF